LDYLFDRDTQASSNLSGIGRHGKKQLDPLLIYAIRCHLISRFAITDDDWRKLKLNIDSKCRTAYRRKVRGMPLTVKAFKGKYSTTYAPCGEGYVSGHDTKYEDMRPGGGSDDSFQQDDTELLVQEEVDLSKDMMSPGSLIQRAGRGRYQVLHATPEQVARLQQTHQIQILQPDQLLQLQQAMNGRGQESLLSLADGLNIVTSEDGETIEIKEQDLDGLIAQDHHTV
jgi:hypothetical protein